MGCPEAPWDGLILAVSADRALIGPEAARLFLELLGGAERAAKRDGIRLPPHWRRARDVLAVVSAGGHGDVPELGAVSVSAAHDEEIGTGEVASMIGRSQKQAGRLVQAGVFGSWHEVGGRLRVSRAEVAAYVAERRTV